ncbi:MAG: hypothetical protein IBJ11_07300, partial [Phycisphaerales bacterium]|nr:hypothetical protein [Phycisphaerales bacterium]
VGTVNAIEFVGDGDGRVSHIDVRIGIDRAFRLRAGARAFLNAPLLGGTGFLNFPSLGTGAELSSKDPIPGDQAPPNILGQAGYGEEQKQQLQNILRRADYLSAYMLDIGEEAGWIVRDFRAESWPRIKGLIDKASADYDGWSGQFGGILKDVKDTTAKGPALAESIEARLNQIREVIDENRANVRDTLANAKTLSEGGDAFVKRLNEELTPLAKDMLTSGRDALEKADRAVAKVDTLLTEERPNIRRSLASFRLGADQLRDTLLEVRRSPWRLLYRPDARESEVELLYDSARAYATAVSDLRATTEAIESLTASPAGSAGAGSAADQAALRDLAERLARTKETYDQAERAFLERINAKQK